MKEIAKLLGLDAEATEEQIAEALKARLENSDFSAVAKELDLKEDASADEIVAAIKAKGESDEETLEDRAKAEGKILVAAKDFDELKGLATKGAKAAEELHQSKFDTAFDKALDEVRVDAKDETRKLWQTLFDADDVAALKALADLPKLANTESRGSTGKIVEVKDGVDQERAELDARVKARMKDKDEDYSTALHAVLAEDEEGDR